MLRPTSRLCSRLSFDFSACVTAGAAVRAIDRAGDPKSVKAACAGTVANGVVAPVVELSFEFEEQLRLSSNSLLIFKSLHTESVCCGSVAALSHHIGVMSAFKGKADIEMIIFFGREAEIEKI